MIGHDLSAITGSGAVKYDGVDDFIPDFYFQTVNDNFIMFDLRV